MKRRFSIKYKLFLAIGIIAVIFVSVFSALNIFFFSRYYVFSKKHTLADIYKKVNSAYTGDISSISGELEQMEYVNGVRISIQDKTRSKYSTIFNANRGIIVFRAPGTAPRANSLFFLNDRELKELRQRGYTFSTLRDNRGVNEFLSLIGTLSNDDILIASIPLAYLRETSNSTTFFLLFASLFTLFVCVVIAYFISRHFSKPLIEINDAATSIATLNFDKKYTGKSKDEIGQLGESVNLLSCHLQRVIDDLRQTNLRLEEEIRKERKIDEMRKEFVINVSHELKTPIALIQGYAEGLKINVNSSEEDKNYYCDIIIDEAVRMNRLVMQLLDLSRIEIGKVKPDLCEIDLKGISQEVCRKTRLLAEAKRLEIDLSGIEGAVLGDFDMIEQVLTNYLTNAINHTPEGGRITMSSEAAGGIVRVSVYNEGDPIPEEELPKIWEKFYKVDKSRTRTDGGTGIGLSIVKAVMEAHGGAFGAKNRDGGVEFYFELKGVDMPLMLTQ